MNEIYKYKSDIEHRLLEVRNKETKFQLLKGISIFTIFAFLFLIVLILLENIFHFSSSTRSFFAYTFFISSFFVFVFWVLQPLIKYLKPISESDYWKIAKKVGSSFSQIKDELTNALQLLSQNKSDGSSALIDEAFKRIYLKSKNLSFTDIISFASLRRIFYYAVTLVTIFVAGLSFSASMKNAAFRLYNYNKEFISSPKFTFVILPGDKRITKGDNVLIKIKVLKGIPDKVFLYSKSVEESEFSPHKLISNLNKIYKFNFKGVTNSFKYFVKADGVKSKEYKITVLNRVTISKFSVEIIPPAYSKLPVIQQIDNGNITTLPGSKVKINLTSSKELQKAELVFSNGKKIKFGINQKSAKTHFVIKRKIQYHISLLDTSNISNINPVTYSINTTTDEYPLIEIISPGKNVKLGSTNYLTILTRIADDFGFSKLYLKYRLSASRFKTPQKKFSSIAIPIEKTSKEQEIVYTWDLSHLNLQAYDIVSYYLEIYDNDDVNGPKATKSDLQIVRVPSLDELFTSADSTQQNAVSNLKETLKEAEELKREFQEINNELKQNKKQISWSEKEKIQNALKKFKNLKKQISSSKDKLKKMQNDLEKNNLLSKKTLEKYLELQKLFDQLSNAEMKKAFEKMQEALNSMMRNKVEQNFANMQFNEEMLRKSLERTINLLKRIQIEQKLDELIKRAENSSNKENKLVKQLNKNDLSNLKKNKITREQKDVSSQVDKLQKEMENLQKKMNELNDMPKESMRKLLDEMKKQGNKKLSQTAVKKLQQNNTKQAQQSMQQISQNMTKIIQQLNNLKSNIQRKNQMEALVKMMKITDNLLTLSKQEEALKTKTEKLSSQSSKLRKNADEQNNIKNNLEKILNMMAQLSQKTFAISPEMGNALGKAQLKMGNSISALLNRNSLRAAREQGGAMKALNETATMMQAAMNNLMNKSGGGGMMSLMQQLRQLTQQQMGLNKLTQMLQQGKLTQQQLAQMHRLANQQQLIRKSLQELNKEFKMSGQSKKLSGNLNQIAEEMKEIVTNMKSNNFNDNLVHQQKQILSKLLDAQRSINERDYEKRREAAAGKFFTGKSPAELIFSKNKRKELLRDELLKAIREGYSQDYENLIRKYFNALEKTDTSSSK